MPESERSKTIEVMAHALCPFTDELDGPCMKCPQDEVGPNGGRYAPPRHARTSARMRP